MRDVLLRRRHLMLEAIPEVPGSLISDYVQSGLILHLDGKNKGSVANAWSNLAGSGAYTNYGATFNSDHVYFDGVDDYLRSASFDATFFPTRTRGTIEVVYDNEFYHEQLAVILIARTATRLSAGVDSGGGFYYATDTASERSYNLPITTVAKGSFSVSSARYYENGSPMSLSTDKDYLSGYQNAYSYIGRRNAGSYFKGKIYSIRIYSRQLTEAEVMQNLSVDNLRFNLGLTLQ